MKTWKVSFSFKLDRKKFGNVVKLENDVSVQQESNLGNFKVSVYQFCHLSKTVLKIFEKYYTDDMSLSTNWIKVKKKKHYPAFFSIIAATYLINRL